MKTIYSIDTFKVIAIFGVICLHVHPFEGYYNNVLYYTIDKVLGFSVPYFFLASGYLMGKKLQRHSREEALSIGWRSCKRLLYLFVAWTVIYAVFIAVYKVDCSASIGANVTFLYNSLVSYIKLKPIDVFLQGSIGTLWFLPALAIGQITVVLFLYYRKEKALLTYGWLLYAFGILAGSYSKFEFGIEDFIMNTRNGPFISTMFVAIGWRLTHIDKFRISTALAVLLFGLAVHLTEFYVIYNEAFEMFYFDYAIGSLFYATGVFMLSLSIPNNFGRNYVAFMGPLVLGIYVTHQLIKHVVIMVKPFYVAYDPISWEIVFPVMVLIASAIFTMIMRRYKLTRSLVC